MTRRSPPADRPAPLPFVLAHTAVTPVAGLAGIRLHTAHRASGLARLDVPEADGTPAPAPYWAFAWAGGMALAHYLAEHPETVVGRRVLDLGAGSGLVGIAAARAGAASVTAAEIDPYGRAALGLNAALNEVTITVLATDPTAEPPPENIDIILAGDVFYAADLAARMLAFLDRCLAAGIKVLIGDPDRQSLPLARLRQLASYEVSDFGERKPGRVYAFELPDPD